MEVCEARTKAPIVFVSICLFRFKILMEFGRQRIPFQKCYFPDFFSLSEVIILFQRVLWWKVIPTVWWSCPEMEESIKIVALGFSRRGNDFCQEKING